jgi:uncharacterized protein (TIGR03067 family)
MKILPTTCGIILALVIGDVAVGRDKDKYQQAAVKQEKKCLIGVWKLVSSEGEGKKVPEEILKLEIVRWTITDSTIVWTVGKDNEGADRYTLDPTTNPKAIDLTDKDGHHAPGIYALNGDTLKVCIDEGSEERPKLFATKPDTRLSVWTFKRERRCTGDVAGR